MKYPELFCIGVLLVMPIVAADAGPGESQRIRWETVVNSNDPIPPDDVRNFNSYNQPSVNRRGLVVFRARSRGGPPLGPATHGIYARDMSVAGSPVSRILDRSSHVPHPNNLAALFTETPSFPRIDMHSDTMATRGNHAPGWRYRLDDGSETRAGTTGIYANPFGVLLTGAAKLGNAPGFDFYGVPEFSGVAFEVFPGAPAVTGGNTIVFKGNYTVDGVGRTGVYFRVLESEPAGGSAPAIMLANSTDTLIPGTDTVFGSTAPPSAAAGHAVFVGFDNEEDPRLGGIYAAPLEFQPALRTLVSLGRQVPGERPGAVLSHIGEALAYDGRHVAFWGAWGQQNRPVRLYCPREGNRDRIDYCNRRLVCEASGEITGDPRSICDDSAGPGQEQRCYVDRQVPVEQGIFVLDTKKGRLHLVAKTGSRFEDFLYWNYSGKTPCAGRGHDDSADDGESIRWRSAAFVAVARQNGTAFRTVFKGRRELPAGSAQAGPVDGLYLARGPGKADLVVIAETGGSAMRLDPEAPVDAVITELGIEREGLRGHWLAISAAASVEGGTEEEGVAGIYLARVP